ncbi:hypothetical protein R1sor_019819 [Riccia sorocarpa]|uniref:DUF7869 domain-containing protein n=1 Tax=Riccia sorocarpa TaxID=122646 RepID=A0ABD3IGB6_9MARC
MRPLPGFAASKKRKQFLASMSPPRVLFSQLPSLASIGNAEIEEHEKNTQDKNEDDGPFASEALSDSEEDKDPEHVLVTGRRFKETLREEKLPMAQVGNSRKRRQGEVDSGFVLSKLTPECLNKEQRQFCCKKTCVWNLGINRLRSERKRYFRLSQTERAVYLESLVTKLEKGGVVFRLSQNLTPADGKYHLPNNFTKKEVYDHYMTDMVQVRECLQYSSFKHYWVKFYPLVTIPITNKFHVCDFCELYKSKRDKGVTSIEKAEAVEALKLHRKQQAEERAAAGRRRWKALDSPKDCAYIQVDSMDQKKTALPHFSKQPKSADGAALEGVHLVGAMIFHGKLRTRAFLTYNNLKSDSNLTITVLQKILLEWEGILPPTLYLQLDNTVRENKNNILFAYLAMLLEKKVFTKKNWDFCWLAIPTTLLTRCLAVSPKLYVEEIGRNINNNRRERLVGDMCWFWPVPPERDEHAVDEPVAVTTTEEFRRRIFGQRRPIYSGPRRPPPGSAAADRAAHIGELTEIHDKSFLAVLADD